MSGTAEATTMGGGNKSSEESSRLEQPNDAVPMKSMLQPTSATTAPADAPPTDKNARSADDSTQTTADDGRHATNPSPSPPATTSSDSADQSAVVRPSSPKGKERETAPPPPSKETTQDPTMASSSAVDAVDEIQPDGAGSADTLPVCNITLLLTSGNRHPYKIDAKYLQRRNVVIPECNDKDQPDPFSISVYTLKELILREWRSDWEAKPASPSSIRLIHFGKLLDDKEQLKKYSLSADNPNVVHMSIRPQDLDEEEPKSGSKNLGAGGGDGQRQRSRGCCVIL